MIALRTVGRGTPLLLLHGIGGAGVSFTPQLDALADDYQVLAWDAPGYGCSSDPAAAPGIDGYADAAAEILAERGPGHVVGVSWGGVIATRLAAKRPDLLRSLTLAGSTVGSGRTRDSAARMRERAADLRRLGAQEFARARGPRLVAPGAPRHVVDRVVTTMAAVRLPGYAYAAESMAETDHTEWLGSIGVPTLILVGAEDRIAGVPESRRLADGITGARMEIMPNAGHAANQERPEEFNRLLTAFHQSVEAGGR